MKKLFAFIACAVLALGVVLLISEDAAVATAAEKERAAKPDEAAVERSRKTVQTLDNIFKQTN